MKIRESIRAKIEANAELSKSMLGSKLQGEDFAKKMVDLVNQRKKYFAEERAKAKRNKPMTQKGLHTSVDKNDSEDSDEVGEQEEFVTCTKTPINPVPVAMKTPNMEMDGQRKRLENDFGNCLRTMFEEPLSTDPIWSELGQQKIISWRYYDTCRVHCLNLESMDVYMLSERKYPLSAEVLCTNTTNGYQFTMSNQHKDWLVQEQTALGVHRHLEVKRINLKLYDLMYIIVNVADMMDCYEELLKE
ncbi:hypothetical protein Tco_0365482 [Tanacetum coccineum]